MTPEAADAADLATAVVRLAPATPACGCPRRRAGGSTRSCAWPTLIALTDFAATYLALGLGLDPSLSRHVQDLRDRTR